MRRKSERAKKGTASPEKPEKPKKHRTSRRRKASSSEAESEEEPSPQIVEVPETEHSEVQGVDSQTDEKVWQVKSDDSGSGTGEIKKLKICLSTRTTITPEPEVTPRSRRKLNRTISDGSNNVMDKRHSRHKSRRSTRESKDSTAPETHSEEEEDISFEKQSELKQTFPEKCDSQTPSSEPTPNALQLEDSETTSISLPQEQKPETDSSCKTVEEAHSSDMAEEIKRKVAPSTPRSKRRRSRRLSGSSPERDPSPEPSEAVKLPQISEEPEQCQTEAKTSIVTEDCDSEKTADNTVSSLIVNDVQQAQAVINEQQDQEEEDRNNTEVVVNQTAISLDKNCESGGLKSTVTLKSPENFKSTKNIESPQKSISLEKEESDLSKSPENFENVVKTSSITQSSLTEDSLKSSELKEVFEDKHSRSKYSSEKDTSHHSKSNNEPTNNTEEADHVSEEISKSNEEPAETVETYNATPIVVSRKRRWGPRAKTAVQKPVSISTDILKDIIPNVKPSELEEAIADKKQRRKSENLDKLKSDRPVLPKIVIDNSENVNSHRRDKEKEQKVKMEIPLMEHRKISIVKDDNFVARPPSPARHKTSSVLFITNLVRPFTLPQLKNLLQRTGKIIPEGFWIDRIKSKCFVTYENEEEAVETRHALHGVTWPVSNPKTLQVDFSSVEALEKMRAAEEQGQEKVATVPGTVEDWMREQDAKKERYAEADSKSWDKRNIVREWDVGKSEKERERLKKEVRPPEKHTIRSIERSPEPVRKLKRREEEPPAKMLDDLFRKTKTVPCIYWLPLSAETIAIKEEQRRQHMAEHERRMQELERTRTHRHH